MRTHPGRCRLIGLALVLVSFAASDRALAQAADQRANLIGQVVNAEGEPIEHATVVLTTARPKVGPAILCPSCHVDCGTAVTTGSDGRFTIEDIDASQMFRVMALGDGWSPTHTDFIDPAAPLMIHLEPRPAMPGDPARVLRGIVIDDNGNPVPDARVEPEMFWYQMPGTGGQIGGSSRLDGAEPLAVSDSRGRFSLIVPRPIERMTVRVDAPVMAPGRFDSLQMDGREHTLAIGPGVTVRGRLLDEAGTPLAGRRVGVCGTDRSIGRFFGDMWIGTDESGRFTMQNVPPGAIPMVLYTTMAESGDGGVLEPVRFDGRSHGDEVDLGDLHTGAGVTLRGRAVLSTGGPIPEGSRIMLGGSLAWDQSIMDLSSDGAFEFSGLARGSYSLSLKVPGFHVSRRNPSADPLHIAPSLHGRIVGDTEIVVLLEPGETTPMPRPVPLAEQPLRGVAPGELP